MGCRLMITTLDDLNSGRNIGMSSNGRTTAFGAVYFGSNPSVPASSQESSNDRSVPLGTAGQHPLECLQF